MSVRIDIKGDKELAAALKKAGNAGPKALDAALYAEATEIFAESQKIVPVDTGVLRASGVVEGPKNGEVLIGYGGAAKSYALVQHENLEYRHAEGKSAKYLEKPFTEALTGLKSRLAQRVVNELEAS